MGEQQGDLHVHLDDPVRREDTQHEEQQQRQSGEGYRTLLDGVRSTEDIGCY